MKKILYIFLFMMFAVMACDRMEDARDVHSIYIDVCTEDESNAAETKAPYLATVPSSSDPLEAKVLVSTTSYEYPATGEDGSESYSGKIAVHTDARFTNGSSQLLNGALYNGDEAKQPMVYFSALHPQTGWYVSGTSGSTDYKASFTFNGSQDVMFAPQTTGKYKDHNPELEFKHLLTYIRLSVYAESEEVSNAWGDITSIKIRNTADMGDGSQKIIVDLSKNYDATSVEFEKSAGYESGFWCIGTNVEFPNTSCTLPYPKADVKEVAYVLMAPVMAKSKDDYNTTMLIPEFEIEVATEKRSAIVKVDLMKQPDATDIDEKYYSGSTMGKQFLITLKFTMGNTVAAQAKVTSWKTGGSGVGDFFENETSN